jgi:hypothetical protein
VRGDRLEEDGGGGLKHKGFWSLPSSVSVAGGPVLS